MRSPTLAGQVVLVTGANSGIGEAIAKAMALAGASVIVNYVANEDDAYRVVRDIISTGGRASAVKADVSSEPQVLEMFKEALKTFGTVDILVNNAGIETDAPFVDLSLDQWSRVMGVNLTGAFLCTREAAREFIRRGVRQDVSASAGKIIFISSVHDTIPWKNHVNYASSKGGVSMLMKSVAQELSEFKIRANCISPGAIKTGINKPAWETPEAAAKLTELIPYGRIGMPADIAPAAVWLASDEADYITGTTLYIDGGMLLYPGFRTGG